MMSASSRQSLNFKVERQLAKEKAIKEFKKKAAEESKKKEAAAIKEKFPVGSYCRALYSEDGCFYEGKVILWNQYTCMVKFLGYENHEEVEFRNLKPSKGKKTRKNQRRSVKETIIMDLLHVVDGGEGINGRVFDYNFLTGAGDTENPVKLAAAVYYPPPKVTFPVGSYCRALYSGDGCFYEGKVILWNENTCMVEFLGYKNREEVEGRNLKRSKGKKTRNSQRKSANETIIEKAIEEFKKKAAEEESKKKEAAAIKEKMNRSHAVAGREADYGQVHEYDFPIGAEAAENTVNTAAAANYAPPEVPQNMASFPLPPAPPLPPLCGMNNPSISALLMSWYIAGYCTGFYKTAK